ncbi:MAG TPA: DUF92 domain-containing protein [Anaerolineae bacterium]
MKEAAVVIFVRLIVGLLFSSCIGLLAYRRKSLTVSGIAGAILTGTLIFGLGGLVSGLLLIAFFITSSLLSHYKTSRKQKVAEQFDKGSQRDLGQALANGGAAAFFALCGGIAWLLNSSALLVMVCFAAMVGALASANADTWATELGVLSKVPPRLITHPAQVVEPGTSGGITRNGTLAAAGGALFIGLVNLLCALMAALLPFESSLWPALYNLRAIGDAGFALLLVAAALIGGITGALTDSLLGASAQAIYFSAKRNKPTERRIEWDGTPNRLLKGRAWLNNDWVNFIASLAGAAVAGLLVLVMVAR